MGNNYSYLKIKITGFSARFVFKFTGISDFYKKITVTCGHPDNSFVTSTYCDEQEYNSCTGDYYYYNGDNFSLDRVLTQFDPKKDKIGYLLGRLQTECDLEKYKSTWDVILDWSRYVRSVVPDVLSVMGVGLLVDYLSTSMKMIVGS